MSDRRVHARYPGMEIVRYDRAGKWYFEPTDPRLPRQRVTIRQAALQALWAVDNASGMIYAGLPGGGAFDRAVAS